MNGLDSIIQLLANYGLYINKDKLNMIQEIPSGDNQKLYILFFDNYKVHIKLDMISDKVKVNVYEVIWRNKKQTTATTT